MPLYNLACRAPLDPSTRQSVARVITDTHCRVTGAPPEFVNVVFLDGYPLRAGETINALGGVRTGGNRTADTIARLKRELRAGIASAAGQSASEVVVTLIGVPSSWVMEGGRVMPEPGAEGEWLSHQSP
jgi:hypothetical protein